MVTDSIAEKGRFNRNGLTAIESVRAANFYEAMQWFAMNRHLSHIK